MRFDAGEHLYDGGAPPRFPSLDRLEADAARAGLPVVRVYHVTTMPPTSRTGARIHDDRVDVLVPCPLSEHGLHEWDEGSQRQETVGDMLRHVYGTP